MTGKVGVVGITDHDVLQELVLRDQPCAGATRPRTYALAPQSPRSACCCATRRTRGSASFEQVLELAEQARGSGREREAREQFIELVRKAGSLAGDPR